MMKLNDLEEELELSLKKEIARELVFSKDQNVSDDDFEEIWLLCNNNPWNADIIYELLKFKENGNETE